MITVNDILAAYKETGIIPIADSYISVKNDKLCGCGATALYCHKNNINIQSIINEINTEDEYIDIYTSRTAIYVRKLFGIANFNAFLHGFDGYNIKTTYSNIEKEYYIIGYEAARQLGLIPFRK